MGNDFGILVNTTDSFEDCWYPFFKLFKKYWNKHDHPIFLNTETKEFSFEGLNIKCTKNSSSHQKKTWSECLLYALDSIENPIILYLQEDYFIKAPVNIQKIDELCKIMKAENIDCIRLSPLAPKGSYKKSEYNDLLELENKAAYRISLQASFWRKEVLRFYLRKHENPWQFEFYGTKRAHRKKHKMFIINNSIYKENVNEIIPYTPTGVVNGKWNKEAVVDLFQQNKIKIDFMKRGFFNRDEIVKHRKDISLQKILNTIRSYF